MKKDQKKSSELVFLNKPLNEFLNKEDFDYYKNLKKTLSSHICRNCRNRRVESFSEILTAIRYFVDRTKEDAWKRALVCGVCWYNNYICVNIRQMSEFLEKCKSSINGSFQRLSLIVLQNKQQSFKIITEAIPFLKNHQELRKMWSVRHLMVNPQIYGHTPTFTKIRKSKPERYHPKSSNPQPLNSSNKVEVAQNKNTNNSINLKNEIHPPISKKDNDSEKESKDNMDLFREINSLEEIFD